MKRLKGITQETKKYLEMLIGLQLQSYAMPIFEKFLNPAVIADLQRVCPIPLGEDEMQSGHWNYCKGNHNKQQALPWEDNALFQSLSS